MDLDLRFDVAAWAVFALVLFGLEVLAPGAFMLWLAFAASAVMIVVWLIPGLSFLLQAILQIVPLVSPIERGTGRVQIADAYWTVRGPDLPTGASVRIVGADGMTLQVEAVD